jgi:single-stranded-DNA-specific exonuclease
MTLRPKRWQVAPKAPPSHRARFPDLHPIIIQMLYNRGITHPDDVSAFLDGEAEDVNPFALPGMANAVTRIRRALRNGETIAVYGDFDADGVTATALLVQTLQALGGDVRAYIPHRVDEGYGLHKEALTELAQDDVQLIITVDCGIRAYEQAAHAKRLGLDVVVTDHHSVGPRLPNVVAAIDPKREDNDRTFDELAGVGVAYRLAQALLRSHRQSPVTERDVRLAEEELLDLVAIGTVADMVPLRGENRTLVRRGLELLNRMEQLGVAALAQEAGLKPGQVTTSAIGYVLGPRLNAAGRIAHAELAYRLLMTDDADEAADLASQLDSLNRQRQERTREAQEQARQMVIEMADEANLLFAAAPDFSAGIAGLVASRLTDEFYRPSIVVEMGEKLSRGSARSIPEFHITRALDACEELLDNHGGHAAAGGFTVRNEHLDTLAERLHEIASDQLVDVDLTPTLPVDVETELSAMSWDLLEALGQLEPYGYGNPQPLFVSRAVQVRRHRAVGRENRHLKLTLSDGRGTWDAIAFRQGEWADQLPEQIDVAYHLELNEWNGRRMLQLNVQDLRPTQDH